MDRKLIAAEHVAILFEDMKGQFRLIAEGLRNLEESLRREINEFRTENREEHEDFRRVMKSFGVSFSNHENRIGKLEKTVYHSRS